MPSQQTAHIRRMFSPVLFVVIFLLSSPPMGSPLDVSVAVHAEEQALRQGEEAGFEPPADAVAQRTEPSAVCAFEQRNADDTGRNDCVPYRDPIQSGRDRRGPQA